MFRVQPSACLCHQQTGARARYVLLEASLRLNCALYFYLIQYPGFALVRSGKSLFQFFISGIEFQRSLVSTGRAGLFLCFHITIADAFKTVDAGQLLSITR